MPGPQGFERLNTNTSGGSTRESGTGFPGLSSLSVAIRARMKLLATISVAVMISTYAGSGLASGGSEGPDRPSDNLKEVSSVDQYDREGRADEESEASSRQIPPEEARSSSRTGAGLPRPVPFSYHSFTKDISAVGEAPASGIAKGGVGERAAETDGADTDDGEAVARANAGGTDAHPRASSAPTIPVSYNAEPYCRTHEKGVRSGGRSRPATNARAVFPLPETFFDSYDDTWGAARPQGGHEGTDLMSPTGTPLYALTDGTVVPVSGSNADGWNYLGGYTVMVRATYSIGPVKKGDLFYYAHMDRESPLPIGTKVEAGEQVGVVGNTGYGSQGTRGQFPPHLHLGWYDTTGATAQAPSGAMNPYPLLEWLKRNGGTAAGGWGLERATEGYCDYQERISAEPPATNEGEAERHDHDLPPGVSSGSSADLDTGSSDPRPSPVVERVEPHEHSHSRAVARTPRQGSEAPREPSPIKESVAHTPGPDSGDDNERPARESEPAPGPSGPARIPEPEKPQREKPQSTSVPGSGKRDENASPGRPSPDRVSPPRSEPEPPAPAARPERRPPAPEDAPEPDREAGITDRASILTVVFRDEDANGVRDAGEEKLSGWPVEVSRPGDAGADGESGERIEGLEPGIYRVTVEPEEGYLRTTAETVRARAGERGATRASFGFAEPADLAVLACADARDEPCPREGEMLRRWKLELRDESGRLISAAVTGRDGEYRFPELLPGVYELTFAPRSAGSSGDPESVRLDLAAGEFRSLKLKEKNAPAERRDRSPETDTETNVETPARETEEERT